MPLVQNVENGFTKYFGSVLSGPPLGAVGLSSSPAGEGPPPHIWPGGGGWGQSLVLWE